MRITKQEAAAARAAAAQTADAKDRLSALEVERNGYVQRGDKKGVKAVDDEIAHWSRVAGIPVEVADTTVVSDPVVSDPVVSDPDSTPQSTRGGRAKAAAAAKD